MASFVMTNAIEFHFSSASDDPLVIPFKKVKSTGVEIGKGAYGRVFEVEYEKTRCAAKEIHALLLESAKGDHIESIKADFLCECKIWSLLHHPRIVHVIG